jgi:RES domain-containing protein
MKLTSLEYSPELELPSHTALRRVQLSRARPGSSRFGAVHTRPPGNGRGGITGRFDLMSMAVGYFADSPVTAIHEALSRRERVMLSMSEVLIRSIVVVQTTDSLHLLDLRPHARPLPVLQSLRISHTQELAADALAAGYQGIIYRSAQQADEDCYALFGDAMRSLKLVERQPLVAPGGIALHRALAEALRGSQIPFVP